MIVSDVHGYVFVELPRTGSSAIARELRQQYAGRPILQKHSALADFRAGAGAEQLGYFAFTAVRNPLDDAVSDYFKYVSDHRARYTRPLPAGRWRLFALAQRRLWRKVSGGEMGFPAFFRATHRLPYDTLASHERADFDYVIRFEHLADDFEQALRRIGLEPVRPLPIRNVTAGRSRDFLSYYTPDLIPRAVWALGPYMRRWDYPLPEGWGDVRPSRLAELWFRAMGLVRALYWRHIRFRFRGDRA